MLRKLLLSLAGAALAVVGVIGLVIPVIPGVILLAGAAACFSMVSVRVRHRFHERLHRHPQGRQALRRWEHGRTLRPWPRIKLAFWLMMGSLSAWLAAPRHPHG